MKANIISALHGFTSFAPADRPHGLAAFHVGFASEKRRLGWGWQAIAGCCGVNVLDLRRACGDLPREEAQRLAPPPKPSAKARPGAAEPAAPRMATRGRRPSLDAAARRLVVLRAIADGGVRAREIAESLGVDPNLIYSDISRLRARGLIAEPGGWARAVDLPILTPAGRAFLKERGDG